MCSSDLDEGGSVVQHIDYDYGQEGERLSISGGTEPVEYRYDAMYRLIRLIDGNGNVTKYAYDDDGRLVLTRYPLATADNGFDTVRHTSYDQTGRLLQKVDGRDWVTNYAYGDAGGALTNVSYPLHSEQNVTYGHDALGRVTSMTDGTGSITYTYDDLGNQLTVTTTYTGVPSQTVSYSYYPNGQRQTMVTPAGTYSYAYDATKRLVSLVSPEGTAAWTWLDNGCLGAQTLPSGAWTEYTYLCNGWLSTLTNRDSDGSVLSRYLDLHYRGPGDLDYLVADVPGHAEHTGTTRYSYDHRRQLRREQSARGSGYDHVYEYDEPGNPVVFKGQARTFNADNQETTGDGFVYDGNGNPTTYAGQAASYDVESRLTAYSGMTAAYRGDGLRAWKQEGDSISYLLYDNHAVVARVSVAGAVQSAVVWGANGLLYSEGREFLFTPTGDVIQSRTGEGLVLYNCGFDATGEVTGEAAGWVFGFGGQRGYWTDMVGSLVLLTYRYYDPHHGRFLTRDPIGNQSTSGLYMYTNNSFVSATDACGLAPDYTNILQACRAEKGGATGVDVCDDDPTDHCCHHIAEFINANATMPHGRLESTCAPICYGMAKMLCKKEGGKRQYAATLLWYTAYACYGGHRKKKRKQIEEWYYGLLAEEKRRYPEVKCAR